MGYEAFDDVIALPNDVVTVYHNVTPERYFENEIGPPPHPARARAADGPGPPLPVRDRRLQLQPAGDAGRRIPPGRGPAGTGRLQRVRRRGPMVVDGRSNDWLYVGRIIGNKCQHDLVTAFAHYHRTFDQDARLLLIGDTSDRGLRGRGQGRGGTARRRGPGDHHGQGLRQAAQVGVRRCRGLRLGERARGIRCARSSRPWPPGCRWWPSAPRPSPRP